MLATTHPTMQPVSQKLFHLSADQRAHELYEARLKYTLDRNSDLYNARVEGKQEGLLLGKQEGLLLGKQEGLLLGKREGLLLGKQEGLRLGKQEGLFLGEQKGLWRVAQNMRMKNYSFAEISETTGLSISELSAEFASQN